MSKKKNDDESTETTAEGASGAAEHDPDEVIQFDLPASVKRALKQHAKNEGFRRLSDFQRTHWTRHLRELGLLPGQKPVTPEA